MKKVLFCIAVVLVVLLLILYAVPLGVGAPKEILMSVGCVLLLIVVVFYALKFGGIRCPNCGCRVNAKYGRNKSFEGRFPCPKCGTMIEM